MDQRDEAERIIREHLLWSVGAGLVPVPLVDLAAVTGIQLDMLKQLCRLYGVDYSISSGKAWVSALTGSLLARFGANALKLIPGIGTLLGGASMAVMAGASTYAIGNVAVKHFEAGGSFADFDPERARADYETAFEEGKTYAGDLARNRRKTRDAFEKLEKLGALKEKGIITEAEFEAKKKQLLETIA
ncbi:MAG: DUF697 domain-containing protein [Deltaproteobacteria bacterium]|nr:MAG: DUF697 domain-containing protein [Deltaproteobacteria bacterium]